MSQTRNVSGSAWPTTYQAATVTSILGDANGLMYNGTVYHVPSTDLPDGCAATGYLQCAEGSDVYLNLEPFSVSGSFLASAVHGIQRFWARIKRTGNTISGSPVTINIWQAGSVYIGFGLTIPSATAPGMSIKATLGGMSTPAPIPVPMTNQGGNASIPVVPFDEWFQVTVHVFKHASTGYIRFYINDTLVFYATDANTNYINWGTNTQCAIHFANQPGIVTQITGPLESYQGASADITPRPRRDLIPSDAHIQGVFRMYGLNVNGDFTSSGGTVTAIDEGDAGTIYNRKCARVLAGGGAATFTSIDEIGTPRYDENGWWTACFNNILLPLGGSAVLKLLNPGMGDTALKTFTCSGSSIVDESGVTIASFTGASTHTTGSTPSDGNRFNLLVHLHQDGRCNATVFDQSTDIKTNTPNHGGAVCKNWVPQPIGKVSMVVTPTASIDAQISGVVYGPGVGIIGGDSISCSQTVSANYTASGLTNQTAQLVPSLVARYYNFANDSQQVPGAYYFGKEYGLPYYCNTVVTGIGGLTRQRWTAMLSGVLPFVRAAHLNMFDGFSINDIYNASDMSAALTQLMTDVDTLWNILKSNRVKLVTTTMAERPAGGGDTNSGTNGGYTNALTLAKQQAVKDFNSLLVQKYHQIQQYGLIKFADLAQTLTWANLYAAADAVHPTVNTYPTADGASAIAFKGQSLLETVKVAPPRTPSAPRSVDVSAAIFDESYNMIVRSSKIGQTIYELVQDYADKYGIALPQRAGAVQVKITGAGDLTMRDTRTGYEKTLTANTTYTFSFIDCDQVISIRSKNQYKKYDVAVEIGYIYGKLDA